jgi:S-DNA-T family DNA segregation ATPase FtsK/SpoIIIE
MATRAAQGNRGASRSAAWRDGVKRGAKRSGTLLGGSILVVLGLVALVALASYRPSDPSFNTASAGPVNNWMGWSGAYGADLLLGLFGPGSGLLVPLAFVLGLRLARGTDAGRWGRSLALTLLGIILAGTGGALLFGGAVNGLPAGWGGAFGLTFSKLIEWGLASLPDPAIADPVRIVTIALTWLAGAFLLYLGLGLRAEERQWIASRRLAMPKLPERRRTPLAQADEPDSSGPDFGNHFDEDDEDGEAEPAPSRARTPVIAAPDRPRTVIADRVRPEKGSRPQRERQPSLALGDSYQLPTLDLLAPPPPPSVGTLDKASLERNARLLETVLEDFSVKGEIIEVRPGPVVTMYELEPASGIKASRVISLADDIARNMSALSARVATIPGRSVIGIELPNAKRELVSLVRTARQRCFRGSAGLAAADPRARTSPAIPSVADLAPMPHLLVAGTTGSGKSVGLNCMILSLLYRLTPEQCRMIMIDPKMLELSIYDDIPHLLSPS